MPPKKIWFPFLVMLFLFMFCARIVHSQELFLESTSNQILRLATLEWPPYTGKELSGQGFATEIVTTVLHRAGYDVTIDFLPWARVLKEVKKGTYDAGFPAYYSEDRAKQYLLSDSFLDSPLVFFKHKKKQIIFEELNDLKGLKIGVVRGYVNTAAFDEATTLTKVIGNSDLQNLRGVGVQRLDLAIVDLYTALLLIDSKKKKKAQQLEPLIPPLALKTLHLMGGRTKENNTQVIRDFNATLNKLIADGTVQNILRKHGMGPQ